MRRGRFNLTMVESGLFFLSRYSPNPQGSFFLATHSCY